MPPIQALTLSSHSKSTSFSFLKMTCFLRAVNPDNRLTTISSDHDREQDTCQVDDAGHGDAGEEGAHHDELGCKVFKIVKFDGVEDGIDGAGDRGHDEDGLLQDRGQVKSCEVRDQKEKVGQKRSDDESNRAADPGIDVSKDDGTPMDLDAEGKHDDGDEGIGTVFKDRPEKDLCHVEAGEFDGEDGDECVDDGHVEDDGDRIARCQLPFAGLIEAQRIQCHIHLYEEDSGAGTCLREIGRLSINDVGGIAEDEGDQGDADVAVIGKHGAIFEALDLADGHPAEFSVGPGGKGDEEHLHECHEEDVQERHVDFRDVDAVEDEAREYDEEGELIERNDIQMVADVQEVADGDEDQKRQYVIRNDLQESHVCLLIGKPGKGSGRGK